MQHDPELRDDDDLRLADAAASGSGSRSSSRAPGTSWKRRRVMMLNWARATCGMMGRSPDFMNVTFAAWAGAAEYFAQCRPEFGDNVRAYHQHISERDLTLTHALINLQKQPHRVGRAQPRGGHRAARGARDRRRRDRARRARAGHAGADRRRDRGLLAAPGPDGPAPQPLRAELRDPLRHAGAQVPVPRELRPRAQPLRPSAGLALRGDGLRGVLRRRAGAVGARLSPGRHQPDQRHRR